MAEASMNKKGMLGAALAGMVAGVVAGILFAPKSGKETRKDIADLAGRIKNDVTHKLSQLTQVTKETYEDVVNSVTKRYEDAKEITQEEAGKLKDEFQKNYNSVKEAAESDRKASKGK